MIREAVILAGGFGTRLRSVVNDVPKSMAPVRNIPFLSYVLEELNRNNFSKAVLAVGYKHDVIKSYFGNNYRDMKLVYSVEKEPLGTGGAIALAAKNIDSVSFFIFNGDTYFNVDFIRMEKLFVSEKSDILVALKEMRNFDRYGNVSIQGNKIISFNEKQFCIKGFINGGIYLVNRKWFIDKSLSEVFSLEKEILEKAAGKEKISAYVSDGYFIDIGIPEDYERASMELPAIDPSNSY
jgi:D-glycero-alpha-D-manno-heptose 1-phosphate guanylyltransferase